MRAGFCRYYGQAMSNKVGSTPVHVGLLGIGNQCFRGTVVMALTRFK